MKSRRKQYTTKIEQWGIGKNIKGNEMRAIIRKEKQRKMEHPPKESIFRVRKHPVEPHKIERFKREKCTSNDDSMMLDAGMSPCLIVRYCANPQWGRNSL